MSILSTFGVQGPRGRLGASGAGRRSRRGLDRSPLCSPDTVEARQRARGGTRSRLRGACVECAVDGECVGSLCAWQVATGRPHGARAGAKAGQIAPAAPPRQASPQARRALAGTHTQIPQKHQRRATISESSHTAQPRSHEAREIRGAFAALTDRRGSKPQRVEDICRTDGRERCTRFIQRFYI